MNTANDTKIKESSPSSATAGSRALMASSKWLRVLWIVTATINVLANNWTATYNALAVAAMITSYEKLYAYKVRQNEKVQTRRD